MGRIAIVDDATDTLELFEVLLSGEHEIQIFAHAGRFLKQFGPKSFDVIVLDIVMPEMDGYEVLKRIREQDSDVPVIATTADARPGERDRVLKAGFSACFTKPIADIENFKDIVFRSMGNL